MFKTDVPTAATALPAPSATGAPGYFTNGDAGAVPPVPRTVLDADYMNMLMMEVYNVVVFAGLTPSKTTYTQLLSAIQALVADAGGSYDPAGAAAAAQAASLQKAANLSDLANVATALANLGISLQGIAKAWVRFDDTGAILRQFGPIATVIRLSTGTYQIQFSSAAPTAEYVANLSTSGNSGGGPAGIAENNSRGTGQCTVVTFDTSNHTIGDAGPNHVAFFW